MRGQRCTGFLVNYALPWVSGVLSVIKNLSELILAKRGCLLAKRAFNTLHVIHYMQNKYPRSREFNVVTVGHLVWWFPAKLDEFSKIGGRA